MNNAIIPARSSDAGPEPCEIRDWMSWTVEAQHEIRRAQTVCFSAQHEAMEKAERRRAMESAIDALRMAVEVLP